MHCQDIKQYSYIHQQLFDSHVFYNTQNMFRFSVDNE